MNVLTRGMRNAFRNPIRTVSIVLILGLSIGLALAMLIARAAVENKIQSVKSSIGNTITISPAGARGFEGGGEPLTTEQIAKVAKITHVANVTQSLHDRLTTDNTNLVSAIEPGSLGNRRAGNSGVTFQAPPDVHIEMSGPGSTGSADGTQRFTRIFTPPVMITGVNLLNDTTYGGSGVSYTSGSPIDVTKDEDVAVVGKALAEKNALSVGSTFQAYGKTLTVKGIYDAGNDFANNGVIVPLSTLQRISDQTGVVTDAVATVNSIDNVAAATSDIKNTLGDAADVVNNLDTVTQAIQPLESVKTISTVSLVGAVIAGAVIILLTMIMIVRERRREIGVYKAIGASNMKIMVQFISEAVTLTLLAMIAGLIIGATAANPATKMLVNNSANSTTQQSGPQIDSGGLRAVRIFGGNTVANARSVEAHIGYELLAYGFSAALIIAIIGSALPALLISKIRPAEVMRAE